MTKNLPPRRHRSFNATTLALLVGTLVPLNAADFAEWKFRQEISIASAGITSLTLPSETLDAARLDRGDLRLIDPAGREVAFALRTDRYGPQPKPTAAVRSFHVKLGEAHTEIVIDCGTSSANFLWGSVELETPAQNFIKRARIEYSADHETWSPAEDGVPFFRQSGVEQLTISAVREQFIRVTLDDTRSKPVPFVGAKLWPPTIGHEREFRDPAPLGVRIVRREEFAGETTLTLQLDHAKLPLARMSFETPERLFTRSVTVGMRELQDENATERTIASGSIYNITDAGPAPTITTRGSFDIDGARYLKSLHVALNTAPASRELIVHVANGDSPPLALSEIKITHHAARLFFDAAVSGAFTLFSGHPQIKTPSYDISRNQPNPAQDTPGVRIGPLTPNPAYRAPEALAGVALAGAALDVAPWRFRKPVRVATAGVQQLELDLDVLAQAQRGLGDVRLVRDGAQVPFLLERPNLSRALELTAKPADDPRRPRVSRWEIALPRAGLPLTRLTLASPTALFQRHLRLFEINDDGRGNRNERTLASADWNHTPEDKRPLTLAFSAAPAATTLVLETDNGDNPPIALGAVTAAHPVARLLFKTDTAPVALYYGQPQAAAPRYDLTLVAGQIIAATKEAATLGPEESMQPEGWKRTLLGGGPNSILFWGVLALVVAVLLAVVAKLLPKPPAA